MTHYVDDQSIHGDGRGWGRGVGGGGDLIIKFAGRYQTNVVNAKVSDAAYKPLPSQQPTDGPIKRLSADLADHRKDDHNNGTKDSNRLLLPTRGEWETS